MCERYRQDATHAVQAGLEARLDARVYPPLWRDIWRREQHRIQEVINTDHFNDHRYIRTLVDLSAPMMTTEFKRNANSASLVSTHRRAGNSRQDVERIGAYVRNKARAALQPRSRRLGSNDY